MRTKDIKDVKDLRDLSTNDVVDLLEDLRATAMKRGTELLGQGRVQARRAIGAPDKGAVASAFVWGILLGAAVGAIVAVLSAPWTGDEARRRLSERAERMRERVAAGGPGNGELDYERMTTAEPTGVGSSPS